MVGEHSRQLGSSRNIRETHLILYSLITIVTMTQEHLLIQEKLIQDSRDPTVHCRFTV
jgi:hypothetical protein